jgi:hypothetical protein
MMHSEETLLRFSQLEVASPSTFSEIGRVIDVLKEKKTWYQSLERGAVPTIADMEMAMVEENKEKEMEKEKEADKSKKKGTKNNGRVEKDKEVSNGTDSNGHKGGNITNNLDLDFPTLSIGV